VLKDHIPTDEYGGGDNVTVFSPNEAPSTVAMPVKYLFRLSSYRNAAPQPVVAIFVKFPFGITNSAPSENLFLWLIAKVGRLRKMIMRVFNRL